MTAKTTTGTVSGAAQPLHPGRILSSVGDLLELVVSNLAGRLLDGGEVRPKGFEDVVTGADMDAETMLIRGLRTLTPGLRIESEETASEEEVESRTEKGSDYWVVDPLDGSQNFAYGLPLAGVAVSLLRENRVILAAAADVFSGSVLLACDGSPAQYRDRVSGSLQAMDLAALAGRAPVGRVSLLRGSRTDHLHRVHRDYLDAVVRLNDRFGRVSSVYIFVLQSFEFTI